MKKIDPKWRHYNGHNISPIFSLWKYSQTFKGWYICNSAVRGPILNPSQTLWLSFLSAIMKKIKTNKGARFFSYPRSKWLNLAEIQTCLSFHSCPCYLQEWTKSIQKWKCWSGHKISLIIYGDVSRHLRAANFSVPDRILPNFKPIPEFMAVLITCKNREEPIKRSYGCHNNFPIITLWELSVAIDTWVLIRSCPKRNAANPLSKWCSRWNLILIGLLVLEIFISECADRWTHWRMDASLSSILSAHRDPSAHLS